METNVKIVATQKVSPNEKQITEHIREKQRQCFNDKDSSVFNYKQNPMQQKLMTTLSNV